MKDIELPPLPHWCEAGSPFAEQMQAYARAAVEAAGAQSVPDWSHPKVQALIGSDARKRIQIDLLWRILENPNDDFGPSDMEYWDAIHDRLKSAMLASTPAQPAQQEPSEAEMVCAETYQVVGCLLSDLGLFETEAARKILDNLSEARMVHQDVLPWEPAAQHQEPPQQERKPMTDEQDRALCEAFCNAASDEYFKARPQLDSDVNRRIFYAGHRKAWLEWQTAHGIKE